MNKKYTFTEADLQPFANPSCKKCLGTGRIGYINKIAQTCRCVKQSLNRVRFAGVRAIETLKKEEIDA